MEQTIPLGRGGKFGQLVVDDAKFSDTIRQHIWNYGLRQVLNDAIADKTDLDGEAIVAKAQKRLDALYAGELRVRSEASEPADPVEAEAHRIAKSAITKMAKEFPEWKDVPKGTKDRALHVLVARATARGEEMSWEIAVGKYLTANPKVRRNAERIVREREEAQSAAADIL